MTEHDLRRRLRDEYETRLAESGNDMGSGLVRYMVGAFDEGVALALAASRAEEARAEPAPGDISWVRRVLDRNAVQRSLRGRGMP